MLIEKTRTSTVGQGRLPMTTKKLYIAHVSIKVYIYPELGLVISPVNPIPWSKKPV